MALYYQRLKDIKKRPNEDILKFQFLNKPVSLRLVDLSDETISLLTSWRSKFWDGFDTKFHVTQEGTFAWIKEKILSNPDRTLFILYYNNQKIGHVGLSMYNEKENSVYFTDIMRGERGFAPGLMEIVFNRFVEWIQNELKISAIRLRVFQDDDKAISLYKKCGLEKIDSIPMKKQLTDDGWKWIKLEDTTQDAKRFFDVMEITS